MPLLQMRKLRLTEPKVTCPRVIYVRKDRAGNEVSSLAVGSPNNKPAGDLCSTFASWPLLRRLHAQNLMPVVAILEFSLLSLNPSFAREGDGTTEHAWSHPYPFPQDGFCLPCGPFAFLAGAASPFCSPIQKTQWVTNQRL